MMRRRQSPLGLLTPWSRLSGFVTQRVGVAPSALCLSFMRPNPVRNGSWSCRLAAPRSNATDSGDPECPVYQRLGMLGRSGQNGTEARMNASAGPIQAHTTARGDQDTEARTRRMGPPGPWHRTRPPGYGRSTASAGASQALATGRGYQDTDAQLRRLEPSGPRPPVVATLIIKPSGPVTKDHGQGRSNPDGSLESTLGLRDQAKANGGQEYQGPVDRGLNILGRSQRLTPVCTTGHDLTGSLT